MNKFLKRMLTAAVAAAVTASGMSFASSAEPDGSFTELSAEEITNAMGVGWNLGNQFDASINGMPDETAWGNPVASQQLIAAVKDAGFDTIRIPVTYMGKIGAAPDYTVDEAWLDRVQQVVDWSIEEGFYVIINMHHDGSDDDYAWLDCTASNQTEITAKYAAVWEQIAEKFKDYDEHLIFESFNEVGDGRWSGVENPTHYDNLNNYNQTFVDTVRSTGGNNGSRWLLVPGWYNNIEQTTGDYGFEIPTDELCTSDENRIMISAHYYDPYNFCLNEDESVSWYETEWGTDEEKAQVVSDLSKLYDAFISQGYPVILGEYGCIDKDNEATRAEYLAYVASTAVDLGMVPIYWDNGYNGHHGFGLFDRNTCEVTEPQLLNAIIQAAPPQENPPAEDSSSESTEDSSSQPVEDSSSQPAEDSSSEPVEDSSSQPADDLSSETVDDTSSTADSDIEADSSETSAPESAVTSASDSTESNADNSPDTGSSNALVATTALILISAAGLAAVKSKKE